MGRLAMICATAMVLGVWAVAPPRAAGPRPGAAQGRGAALASARRPRLFTGAPLLYHRQPGTGSPAAAGGVWEMDGDGADPRQLFGDPSLGCAALSPDGTELACVAGDGDAIAVVTLGGQVMASFTVPVAGPRGVGTISWSARGVLAYDSVTPLGTEVTYTVDSNGQSARLLTTAGGAPSWNPSGTAVVVQQNGAHDGSGILSESIVTLAGAVTPLYATQCAPYGGGPEAWAPDGSAIYFTGCASAESISPAGGPPAPLPSIPFVGAVSPDSSTIAFTTGRNDSTSDLSVAPVDGGPPIDIDTGNAGYLDVPIAYLPLPAQGPGCSATLPSGVTAMASTVDGAGYWIADAAGDVAACGEASFEGSLSGSHLARPVVGLAADPVTSGYWLVAADGGVFAFDAPFFGSMAGRPTNAPVVGMAAAPGGAGYWLVAADGGVFAFGAATYLGSAASLRLQAPVVGMAAARSGPGGGYWLVAADGGVFAYGAPFFGSMAGRPTSAPVVGLAAGPGPGPGGYWLVAADGGVFAFGGAPFRGSAVSQRLARPVVGASADAASGGYWLVATDGGVFAYGAPFLGSAA